MAEFTLRGYRDELWSSELTFKVKARNLAEAQVKVFESPETFLVAQGAPYAVETIREFPEEPNDYSLATT